jgi:predicted alpha/beta-hydrolase family hydrolase
VTATSLFLLRSASSPDAPPLAELIQAWRAAGIHVDTHDYDDHQSDDELVESCRAALLAHCQARTIGAAQVTLGGFSRGARLAAMLAQREEAYALLCLGFPFHKRGAPLERHGLDALRELTLPTLIVQGTRDAHGSWQEVRGYGGLPECVKMHWLEDGNHRFQAREKSDTSDKGLLQSASTATIDFLGTALHLDRDD